MTSSRPRRRPRAPGPVLQLMESRAWLEAGASLALLFQRDGWKALAYGDALP